MNPAKVPHHLQRHSCGRYRPFPVVENGRIVGAITRFDLLRAVRGYLRRAGARLLTLTGTSRVSEALELFEPRPNLQEDFPVLADDFGCSRMISSTRRSSSGCGRVFALRSKRGDTSIWIAGQRRWVFLKGCVTNKFQSTDLERLAREVDDVEIVFNELMVGIRGKPKYRTAAP